MITSTPATSPTATTVRIDANTLCVVLSDGREVTVPISWYPRLSHAKPYDLQKWEMLGGGHGIHWPELDEDISIDNILFGQPSGESARSFSRWLEWYHSKSAA